MIERNLTEVRSIIIELGDFKAHMTVIGTRNWIPHPRGGDVHDLWRLQALGYREYRINIHTNQELFDWRGVDAHQEEHYEARFVSACDRSGSSSGSSLIVTRAATRSCSISGTRSSDHQGATRAGAEAPQVGHTRHAVLYGRNRAGLAVLCRRHRHLRL